MKSDIEIAQSVTPLKITEVAEKIGLSEDDLELYGKYKAKISDEALKKLEDKPDGKSQKAPCGSFHFLGILLPEPRQEHCLYQEANL